MGTITDGVEFDTIAREWRCKWSEDKDKLSLQEAQKSLEDTLSALKAIKGCTGVHRVVCGGNLDFKASLLFFFPPSLVLFSLPRSNFFSRPFLFASNYRTFKNRSLRH
jgi:hypothetical protein